jgi:hypothetical protein
MRRFRLPIDVSTVVDVLATVVRLGVLTLHSRTHLAAENLFLRKQLALYLERQVKPRRADDATRIALVALSRFVGWRQLLVIVKPDTLIRWHRRAFRLFWRWKSQRPGRPPIPANLRQLIAQMVTANQTWGEERIADELLLKLGIRVSPRRYGGTCRCDRRAGDGVHKRGVPSCGTTPDRYSPATSLSSSRRRSA